MLRALVTISVLAVTVVIVVSVSLVFVLFRVGRAHIDRLYRIFYRVSLWITGTRLVPPLWHTKPSLLPPKAVIVSNHESHLDVPAVCMSLWPRSIRFVAKTSLFRIPFFGWGLRVTGNIPVSRDGRQRDLTRLDRAEVGDGDILFFAEGSRGREGSYRDFKKGAFAFAIQHGLPIIPVAVGGSFECQPPHVFVVRPGKIAVVVGDPIEVSRLKLKDRHALRDEVWGIVAELRVEALRRADSPRARA